MKNTSMISISSDNTSFFIKSMCSDKSEYDIFIDSIKTTSDIREIFRNSDNHFVFNALPDYRLINNNDQISTATSYFSGQYLDSITDTEQFLCALRSVYLLIDSIKKETDTSLSISFDKIICEDGNSNIIHVLWIEYDNDAIGKTNADIASKLKNTLTESAHRLHPLITSNIKKMITLLETDADSKKNYHDLSLLCEEIYSVLKNKKDFFINSLTLNKVQESNSSFKLFNISKTAYITSTSSEKLENYINSYLNSSALSNYIHIIRGNAENGIISMIESDSFKLRYGHDNFSDRFSVLKEISTQNTLIIIENLNHIDDDIRYLSEISAANILITTTIPAIDLSDYGIENIEDIG